MNANESSDLPWSPELIWAALRLTAGYRKWFPTYETWAKSEVTGAVTRFFESLRGHGTIPSVEPSLYNLPTLQMPYPEPHLEFLRSYGSFLAFPLPPDVECLPACLIETAVVSQPSRLSEDFSGLSFDEFGDPHFLRNAFGSESNLLLLELNLNHPDRVILKQVWMQLEKLLPHLRRGQRKPIFFGDSERGISHRWPELKRQLQAYELAIKSGWPERTPPWADIGRKVGPSTYKDSVTGPREASDWASNAFESAQRFVDKFEAIIRSQQ